MIYAFLFLSIILESSVTTLPLTLMILIFSAIAVRRAEIFFVAFLSGLFLDILAVRPIGLSSLFFVTVVFIGFLYKRKFETDTSTFVIGLSFISSLGYLVLTGVSTPVPNALVASLFAGISFFIYKLRQGKVERYG